jgi:hypothetical protein
VPCQGLLGLVHSCWLTLFFLYLRSLKLILAPPYLLFTVSWFPSLCNPWAQQTDLCLSAYLDHSMSTLYLVFARELYSAAAASYNLQSLYHMYHKLKGSLGVPALHAYTKKMLGVRGAVGRCLFSAQALARSHHPPLSLFHKPPCPTSLPCLPLCRPPRCCTHPPWTT